jgi:hypothetical protein
MVELRIVWGALLQNPISRVASEHYFTFFNDMSDEHGRILGFRAKL